MNKKPFNAFDVMRGQAGGRVVVGRKERGSNFLKSTHYKNIEEFWEYILTEKIDLEWYQVNGGQRVHVDICKECNQYYDRGDTCKGCRRIQ